MKNIRCFLGLGLLLLNSSVFSQTTMKVVGKNLTYPTGQTAILRGVNYPLINQGDISLADAASVHAYIDQVALTGANCVRLPWYSNGQSWRDITSDGGTPGTVNGYVTNGNLNDIIAYCITKNLIPILSIHDDSYITCNNDWNHFNTAVMNFWTSPAVISLINNNQSRIIINLANEFDYVRWSDNQAVALNNFKANYNAAIATLRNAGIHVPIMIDAPDCGQSSTELLSVAESMNTADTEHNLIFSAHAYWGGYANSLAQIQTKLDEAQNTNVCFILGEIAPNQDDGGCGNLNLSTLYPQILQQACSRNIGWLAWTFNFDCSAVREMSSTSSVSNLTVFGNNIINNPNYGLKSTGGCGAIILDTSHEELQELEAIIYPNPSQGRFMIKTNLAIKKVQAFDLPGKEIAILKNKENDYSFRNVQPGSYFLRIETATGVVFIKKFNIQP
ncbi:MAG: hypothetical protein CFE23_01115 [Flavobacterium sp. BFFFF1]|uniref:cellulase family glycosylhydrolase n=1 Tax=Flavobacterium sp. BFFFF1 TaxID=2015557 RepID=UPI000BC6D53E|nr:cellulase family glycosylhydrolase [Flavobacterium sp. BFFFF1]OYU82348.1 MAG: hypothetical protein CFE23_01115 [Flavobacterium sp. BFFFF1]